MAGTKIGGRAAANTNKLKYGDDFYRNIGAKGGSKRNKNKGFGTHRDMACIYGAKGGVYKQTREGTQ